MKILKSSPGGPLEELRKGKKSKPSGSSSKPKAKKAKGTREAKQDESAVKEIKRPNVNMMTKKEYEDLRWGTNPYDRPRDPALKDDSQFQTLFQVSIHYDVILQMKEKIAPQKWIDWNYIEQRKDHFAGVQYICESLEPPSSVKEDILGAHRSCHGGYNMLQ